jgi:Protein of unknown function (DUF4235)
MKALYKPLALLASALGGIVASAVFNQIWRVMSSDREVPSPRSPRHSTREVLLAAALHGAVFGTVKAAVDRAGAKTFKRVTGTDPGA